MILSYPNLASFTVQLRLLRMYHQFPTQWVLRFLATQQIDSKQVLLAVCLLIQISIRLTGSCHLLWVAGAVPGCRHWQRLHERRRPGQQHRLGHQLPGLPAEEELAERALTLHQEHHGKASADLLSPLPHPHWQITTIAKMNLIVINCCSSFSQQHLRPRLSCSICQGGIEIET